MSMRRPPRYVSQGPKTPKTRSYGTVLSKMAFFSGLGPLGPLPIFCKVDIDALFRFKRERCHSDSLLMGDPMAPVL